MNYFSSIYRGWEKESEEFVKLPFNHNRRSYLACFWPFDPLDEVFAPIRCCHVCWEMWKRGLYKVEKRKGAGCGIGEVGPLQEGLPPVEEQESGK
ncbi:hypothetical protein Tco_0022209, partial [Tanacetum coccineum]